MGDDFALHRELQNNTGFLYKMNHLPLSYEGSPSYLLAFLDQGSEGPVQKSMTKYPFLYPLGMHVDFIIIFFLKLIREGFSVFVKDNIFKIFLINFFLDNLARALNNPNFIELERLIDLNGLMRSLATEVGVRHIFFFLLFSLLLFIFSFSQYEDVSSIFYAEIN